MKRAESLATYFNMMQQVAAQVTDNERMRECNMSGMLSQPLDVRSWMRSKSHVVHVFLLDRVFLHRHGVVSVQYSVRNSTRQNSLSTAFEQTSRGFQKSANKTKIMQKKKKKVLVPSPSLSPILGFSSFRHRPQPYLLLLDNCCDCVCVKRFRTNGDHLQATRVFGEGG